MWKSRLWNTASTPSRHVSEVSGKISKEDKALTNFTENVELQSRKKQRE